MSGIGGVTLSQWIEPVNYLFNKSNTEKVTESAALEKSDTVSISPEAQQRLQADQAENVSGNVFVGDSMDQLSKEFIERFNYMMEHLEEVTAEFKSDLKTALKNLGVDTSEPFELTTSSDGSVTVVGDHPDKEKIEKYFEDHPDMRDRFVEISASTSFKRAAELYIEFAKEYEEDPEAAVAKYGPRFAALKREGFSMVIGGGGTA